jgi:hypothetical protein
LQPPIKQPFDTPALQAHNGLGKCNNTSQGAAFSGPCNPLKMADWITPNATEPTFCCSQKPPKPVSENPTFRELAKAD